MSFSRHSISLRRLAEDLADDVRYALRMLRKSPAFTSVAVVSLMLGVGANIAVFGVLNTLLLRPLDGIRPGVLYQIRGKARASGGLITTSYPAFEDFRRRNATFEGMAAVYAYASATLNGNRQGARQVSGEEVTGNYFDLLGAQIEAGRFFHAADERGPDSAPYVVLSDALWRSAFRGDPGAIGSIVTLNDHPFTVIGVASPRFHGTERFEWPGYWVPMVNEEQLEGGWNFLHDRAGSAVMVFGRLRLGVTPRQATEDLNAIARQLAKEFPKTDQGIYVRLTRAGLFGDDGEIIGRFLWGVTGLALLLLVAVCANLASLSAARMADRSRELALRVALGSSRMRLARQLLTEAVVISLIGGGAGVAGAAGALGVLSRWRPSFAYGGQTLALNAHVDMRVCVAGLILTLGSALCVGLLPARHVWQSRPQSLIKSGPGEGAQPRRFALRDLLLGLQIATCTLLVMASLVAVRGLTRALHIHMGIEPHGAILAHVDIGRPGQSAGIVLVRQKALLEAARNTPGVTSVAAVGNALGDGAPHPIPVYRQGTVEFTPDTASLAARIYPMSPGYLDTAGTRLLGGRDVSWRDTAQTPSVAVVNETFARKMWGAAPAIGQRFLLASRLTEVIGLAEDGKYHDLMESPQSVAYVPLSQDETSEVDFVIRSQLAPNEAGKAIGRALETMEPDVRMSVRSWPDALQGMYFPIRAGTAVLGVMGAMAGMLAVTGLFGSAAYSVSRRMKELGIRVALGARGRQVMSAALGRPLVLLGAGTAVGVFAGLIATRLLEQIVFQADPGDPVVLAGVALAMALIGLAASALPARRALAVDPAILLREE